MSKENEKDNGVNPEQDTEDSEGSKEQEEQDSDKGSNNRFEDMSDEDKDSKILELESLIVRNKKKEKKEDEVPQEKSKDDKYLTREEAVLMSSEGLEFDDLEVLKKVQKGEGVDSLKEARDSDLFKAYKEAKDREQRSTDASLPASKGGSGRGKSGFKQGMSSEEHKEEFRKSQN